MANGERAGIKSGLVIDLEVRMPGGKYRGDMIEALPLSYLARVTDGKEPMDGAMRRLLEEELAERGQKEGV